MHKFSLEQYHRLRDEGVLNPADRVELLSGYLVEKITKNPKHSRATQRLFRALLSRLQAGWYAACQEPITLAESEPEPDIWIARGSDSDYQDRHPGSKDLVLVVEVADSSLGLDRGLKRQIYAAAGIVQYWIVNLLDERIERYSDPQASAGKQLIDYKTVQHVNANESLVIVLNERETVKFPAAVIWN